MAVLPLENLSGDPAQNYFADGMTYELTTELAKISALRVISRGSVMQYKGRTGRRRDSRDVLALHYELALAIAGRINIALTPAEPARFANSRAVSPEAHEAYLKGRYCLDSYSEERVKKAIGEFEQAIKIDPNFVLAKATRRDAPDAPHLARDHASSRREVTSLDCIR